MSFYLFSTPSNQEYLNDPLPKPADQRRLIQNAAFIPDENIFLKSYHVHAYTEHSWKGGIGDCYLAVDGGCEYAKRVMSGSFVYEDYCLYDDDPMERVASRMLWSTLGKGGKGPRRWVLLCECETDHLRAILATQHHIRGHRVEKVIQYILKNREKNHGTII